MPASCVVHPVRANAILNYIVGFLLILNAWQEKHWLEPQLIEQPELMQVKLELRIVNATNSLGSQKETKDTTNTVQVPPKCTSV